MPAYLLRALLFVGGFLCLGSGGVPATADEPEPKDPGPVETPFIKAIEDLLEEADFEEDVDVDELRKSLREADAILRKVKEENRRAIEQMNRQVPRKGAAQANVVLVLADDLDPRMVAGETLPEGLSLPAFERLRKDGLRLTEFHSASPYDLTAFQSLLTGRAPVSASGSAAPFRGRMQTLPSVLWHAGYSTGYFGAWPLDGPLEPEDCDCDVFIGFRGKEACEQAYPRQFQVNREASSANRDAGPFAWSLTTMHALANLERSAGSRPLFQMIRYHALPAPERELTGIQLPPGLSDEARERAAQTALLDRELGRLLAHLDRKGLTEQTLLLVVGETPATHRPERSTVDLVRTDALRVPALAMWPNRIPAGVASDRPAGLWDVLPTLAAVAGDQRFSRRSHSVSLLPTLLGRSEPNAGSRLLYWQIPAEENGQIWQTVRLEHWTAIVAPGSSRVELYDRRNDPSESIDVANDHPEVVSTMLRR